MNPSGKTGEITTVDELISELRSIIHDLRLISRPTGRATITRKMVGDADGEPDYVEYLIRVYKENPKQCKNM